MWSRRAYAGPWCLDDDVVCYGRMELAGGISMTSNELFGWKFSRLKILMELEFVWREWRRRGRALNLNIVLKTVIAVFLCTGWGNIAMAWNTGPMGTSFKIKNFSGRLRLERLPWLHWKDLCAFCSRNIRLPNGFNKLVYSNETFVGS